MKIKLDRIISVATLLAAVVAITLVLKKPAPWHSSHRQRRDLRPIPHRPTPSQLARKVTSSSRPRSRCSPCNHHSQRGYFAAPQAAQNSLAPPSPKTEAHSSSDGIGSAISQILSASAGGAAALTPDSDAAAERRISKIRKSTMTEIPFTAFSDRDCGQRRLGHNFRAHGQKDGYATFEPTEFKVGDMDVPVSLVNPALQRKLAEERDRLKLSDPRARSRKAIELALSLILLSRSERRQHICLSHFRIPAA